MHPGCMGCVVHLVPDESIPQLAPQMSKMVYLTTHWAASSSLPLFGPISTIYRKYMVKGISKRAVKGTSHPAESLSYVVTKGRKECYYLRHFTRYMVHLDTQVY